jgi:hypothetical protein
LNQPPIIGIHLETCEWRGAALDLLIENKQPDALPKGERRYGGSTPRQGPAQGRPEEEAHAEQDPPSPVILPYLNLATGRFFQQKEDLR